MTPVPDLSEQSTNDPLTFAPVPSGRIRRQSQATIIAPGPKQGATAIGAGPCGVATTSSVVDFSPRVRVPGRSREGTI